MKKRSVLLVTLAMFPAFLLPLQAEEDSAFEVEPPEITSDYALLTDIDNGQVLYSLNSEEQMYPASITKLMTAILSVEQLDNTAMRVTITEEMWDGLLEANASVAGFYPGDQPTVEELLYGALLPSGADAVNALAITTSGSIDSFVEAMNEKASSLGMNHTHFTNPTGLHDPALSTTASDLSLLMADAINHPLLAEILATRSYRTQPLASHPEGLLLESTSWSLINNGEGTYTIPGYLGANTGFTNPAGRCLASHAEFNGMHLVLVTGHSEGTGHLYDASVLYAWAESHYTRTQYLIEGSLLSSIEIIDSSDEAPLEVRVLEDAWMDLPQDAEIVITTNLPASLTAPVAMGDHLGELQVTVNDTVIYQQELRAEKSYEYSQLVHIRNLIQAFRHDHPFLAAVPALVGIAFLTLLLLRQVNRRKRRRRRRKRSKKQSGH